MMKRNVLKSHLLAGVLSLASVFSAQALDVKSGDVIAFGGDEIVQDALSRDTGFAKLVMSGLAANGIAATAANFGSEAYSAFEFSYEALEDMLAQKPKAAVVCLGIRDIRDGSKPFSGPTGFGVSISNVIERCQAEGVRPILVTPPVWPEENLSSANNVKLLDYVNLMKAAAAHYGVSCYDFNADERTYLAAHPASSSNRQLTSDGLKPNARGGQMAARGILRALGATDANVAAAEAAWAEIKSGTTVTLKLSERQLRTIIQAAKNAGQYKETDYLPEAKAYVLGLIRQSQSVPKVDPYPMTKVPGCYDAPANKTYSYQSGQKIVLIGDSISHMARDHACGYDKLLKWGLEAAGTLDLGAAKYGTVTCNYTQAQLNALTKGTYTVTFTVAATDAWTGLEKTIGVTVNAKQGGGEEPSSGSVTLTCSNYKGTETLANFPMLVRLSEESIPGFSYEGLDASLILFKDASGNELPCDVDTWNPGGESLVWVKVPSLSATTAVQLFWGEKRTTASADVWSAYDGVWHFNEQSGTTFADSKGTYGAASVAVPGTETHVSCSIGPQKLGCGVALVNDGVKREGNMLATESRTLSGAITVSGWYQVTKLRDSTSDTYPNLIRGGAWQGGGFYLQCGTTGDNKSFTLVANADQANLNQNPETVLGGGLHHVAVSVGSDGSKLYIDGIKKCSSASARLSSWTGKFNLLASVRSAAADEVRVQPTVASPDWIAADYQQQASADGVLYAVGAEPPVVEPTINPSTGSSSLEVEANDAESAKKLVVINPPEGSDISRADYAAYFTRTATEAGEGKWLVRVELDETVVRPELAETEDDTAAFEIGAEGGLIRVGNVKPGLYYGYVTAESLQGLTAAKPVMQAEPAKSSATLVMPLPKTSDSAGFYRIVVRERSGD